MSKVRKAIIPAAGLGTRFLPATKSIPKEMLPIVDRPIILYVIEEAVRAGIEDIILISGRGKSAIEDFFDRNVELEALLEKTGKTELLEELVRIRNMANIISIRQKEALGLGHAVLCGQPIVGKESFAVLLGDEIMCNAPGEATVTEQLCQIHDETKLSTVAVMEVEAKDVSKYGIISGTEIQSGRWQVKTVVEKPDPAKAPSKMALPGRYVFTSELFEFLKEIKPGKNGEIQLTDAMTALAGSTGLLATKFKGVRHDAGDKLGYLQANIELALVNPKLSQEFKTYLKNLVKSW